MALITILLGGLFALTPFAGMASGTVTLAWDPSSGTNAIANYNIYYGVASATYTNVVAAGTSTTLSISNLVEGATYYFAATAVDTSGLESDYSTEVSTLIPVKLTNQPPTLNALANISINENAMLQTVSLSGITAGATNEDQTLTVTASSSNPGLIPTPAVSYSSPATTGSLTFTPVAYGFGSATITLTVNDDGTSNNIVSRSFTVTVNPVNQAPTLNALANVTINENAMLQTVNLSGITSGATNQIQTLTVTASSSNPDLIPTPAINYTSPNTTGSITFTPVAYAVGSASIIVTVNNGGASNNVVSQRFTVTVNPFNQAPTLNTLANATISEHAGLQTVGLSGITWGSTNQIATLTVTASSSNPGLIPTPSVNYTSPNTTGSITFTPVASAYGSATVTVTVNNGFASNNVVSRSFKVTVDSPPTISGITNQLIAKNSGSTAIPFTISDAETDASSLTVSASSDNATLVQTAGIVLGGTGSNRTVTVTPVAGQTGAANITITVSDGTATAESTFQLNVRQRPAAPGNFRIASIGR